MAWRPTAAWRARTPSSSPATTRRWPAGRCRRRAVLSRSWWTISASSVQGLGRAHARRLPQALSGWSSGVWNVPAGGLSDRRTRGVFLAWRDRLRCAHRRGGRTMRGAFWRRRAGRWSLRVDREATPARRAGASIEARGRQNLDSTTTRPTSSQGPGAHALAVPARDLDRPAPRRSAAASVERLRGHVHPLRQSEDRRRAS